MCLMPVPEWLIGPPRRQNTFPALFDRYRCRSRKDRTRRHRHEPPHGDVFALAGCASCSYLPVRPGERQVEQGKHQ